MYILVHWDATMHVRTAHVTLTTQHYTTLHTRAPAHVYLSSLGCNYACKDSPCNTHYTTLHYTTLHYTTLHYTTLHYTHTRAHPHMYILVHWGATMHVRTAHVKLTTLHYTTLHYTTLHTRAPAHVYLSSLGCNYACKDSPCNTHFTSLHYTTLHYTTLHYTTLHTHARARPHMYILVHWVLFHRPMVYMGFIAYKRSS